MEHVGRYIVGVPLAVVMFLILLNAAWWQVEILAVICLGGLIVIAMLALAFLVGAVIDWLAGHW